MLKTHTKLNLLAGAVAATLALAVSIPHSGTISLVSPAMAMSGGGGQLDQGSDSFFSTESRPHRGNTMKVCKSQAYKKKDAVAFCTKKLGKAAKCSGKPRRWICR